MLGTFSGTGLLLLGLTLPVLARRFLRTLLLNAAILLPILGVVAVETGWYEIAAKRITTFDDAKSSFYGRFVGPFLAMRDVFETGDPHTMFSGYGAGKTAFLEVIPGVEGLEYNALSKVLLEYGLIVFLVFIAFSSFLLFSNDVPFIIAYAIALEYHFMGGHLVMPPILNYCFILAAGWKFTEHSDRKESSRDVNAS